MKTKHRLRALELAVAALLRDDLADAGYAHRLLEEQLAKLDEAANNEDEEKDYEYEPYEAQQIGGALRELLAQPNASDSYDEDDDD